MNYIKAPYWRPLLIGDASYKPHLLRSAQYISMKNNVGFSGAAGRTAQITNPPRSHAAGLSLLSLIRRQIFYKACA